VATVAVTRAKGRTITRKRKKKGKQKGRRGREMYKAERLGQKFLGRKTFFRASFIEHELKHGECELVALLSKCT
jgi:hypothetical protein